MTPKEPPEGVGPRSIDVQAPPELAAPIAALLPALAAKGVRRLEVFSYRRPGEPPYWLGFILTGDGRHTVGTPDMRHLELENQLSDLIRQLACWEPAKRSAEFD